MRRVVGGLVVVVALGTLPAHGETVWDCELDGRIAGRPSGLCRTTLEPGTYQFEIEGLTRESSGELHIGLGEQLAATCLVVAGAWQCDDGTAGVGPADAWPAFAVEVEESAELRFHVQPPSCGTATCGRDPQVVTGRFRITLTAPEE